MSTILGGSDSNTSGFAPGGGTPNFYIGQLGYANTPYFTEYVTCQTSPSPNGWNATTATEASYVYGFWMLHGPQGTSSGKTDYEWGQEQGLAALESWNNQGCAQQRTVFADIESGKGVNQWFYTSPTAAEQDKNFNVLLGFGNSLINPPSGYLSLKLGVYCSPNTWSTFFGSYTLAQAYATAAWTWRNRNYSSFPTTWEVNGSGENPQEFGGLAPVFWQYDDTSSSDYDACQGTSYLPE